MRKTYKYIMIVMMIGCLSCQSLFLQKPDTTGTVDIDKIYSSRTTAFYAVMACYRTTNYGWGTNNGLGHGLLGTLSGERGRGYDWHGAYKVLQAGVSAAGIIPDDYSSHWGCIRQYYLVMENIDRVPDMNGDEKRNIKGEMTALVAHRYLGMFIRYGGIPIVTKSFEVSEADSPSVKAPRSSLEATLAHINGLCDAAIAALPNGDWPDQFSGRITKGVVLAIKARAMQFAARPLFNRATPYKALAQKELICFGAEDPNRWQDAITANEAVLTWATANGYALINTGGAQGQPNANAFADYGTATSTPANREVLFAYKCNDSNQDGWAYSAIKYYNTSNGWWKERWDHDNTGLPTKLLEQYYSADGTTPVFPSAKKNQTAAVPIADWLAKMNAMEARFKADWIPAGFDSWGNPGVNIWSATGINREVMNTGDDATKFPASYNQGKGCAAVCKFYYNAGTRVWFEAPLFRLAETYLNLAEAYNEKGDNTNALKNLNIIHNRAGLPSITESDPTLLRALIQRERAIELYGESHRYYDVKHWMRSDIGTDIIGGSVRELQFRNKGVGSNNLAENLVEYWDAYVYDSFWADYMYLEPFPQGEMNKGFLVQNPGY